MFTFHRNSTQSHSHQFTQPQTQQHKTPAKMSAPKSNNILRRNRANNTNTNTTTTTTTTTNTNPRPRIRDSYDPDFAQIQREDLGPTPEQQREFDRTGGTGVPPKEYRLRFYCLTCLNRPNHNGACVTAKQLTAAMPTRFAYHHAAYGSSHVWEWELGIEFCPPPAPPTNTSGGGAAPAPAAGKTTPTVNLVIRVIRAVVGPLRDPAQPAPAADPAPAALPAPKTQQDGALKNRFLGVGKKQRAKKRESSGPAAAAAATPTPPTPVVPPPFKVDDFLAGLKEKGVSYKSSPSAFR